MMALRLDMLAPGAYAVACSGGADSVALLRLACEAEIRVHVVHLNHQTRGKDSDADAAFVQGLAGELGVPCTAATLSEVIANLENRPPNPSALYRAARFALFARVCREEGLGAVLLAHHADDQAETVLHRLLRGSGMGGLAGMAAESVLGGVKVIRPLLGVRRRELREYLAARKQGWREDVSNASDQYFRNRLRRVLSGRHDMVTAFLKMGESARRVREWSESAAPVLRETFRVEELHALPEVLARVAARRWLIARGVPAGEIEPAVLERLLRMASDAASPGTVNLPGGVRARRAGGVVSVWGNGDALLGS